MRALRRFARMPYQVTSFLIAAASIRPMAALLFLFAMIDVVEGLADGRWLFVLSSVTVAAWIAWAWRGLGQIQRLAAPIAGFVAAEHDRYQAFLRMEEARRAAEREARGE